MIGAVEVFQERAKLPGQQIGQVAAERIAGVIEPSGFRRDIGKRAGEALGDK
ncbi:MAG: hypothetical protein R3E48_05050 [Burkholderiaceae bacterium]